MRKVIVVFSVLLLILGVGVVNAAQNVAGLSQKGSVLVFPKIDTTLGNETFIKIANDESSPITIKCYWVAVGDPINVGTGCPMPPALIPPKQSASDFTIHLTAYQPIMIQASTGASAANDPLDVFVTPFGSNKKGYLACWATNDVSSEQLNYNHLTGSAVVVGPTSGYEYASWNFWARSGSNLKPVGVPGTILFDGIKFDTMPQYLLYTIPTIGQQAFGANIFQNVELTLIPGKQDFTTLSLIHPVTKATFDVWNENENRYSGVGGCMYCFLDTLLDGPAISNGTFFDLVNMHTSVSRFRVLGKSSPGCIAQLSPEDQEHCLGSNVIFAQSSPLLGLAIQQIGPSGGSPLYLTTIPAHTRGQDATATFKWSPD